jgi:hypothetical protein
MYFQFKHEVFINKWISIETLCAYVSALDVATLKYKESDETLREVTRKLEQPGRLRKSEDWERAT